MDTVDCIKAEAIWNFKCYDKDGNLKWEDEGKNLVVTEGLNYLLNSAFNGATQDSTWFIGLKGTGTPAAGDTLASHATWTENTNYTGDRQAFTLNGASTAGSITNSSSPAQFPITVDSQTISGGFLTGVATGTSGTLFNVKDFTGGDKQADNGDTLSVTLTITASSS